MNRLINNCGLDPQERERLLDGYGSDRELLWFASHIDSCEICSKEALAIEKNRDMLKQSFETDLMQVRLEPIWRNIQKEVFKPSLWQLVFEYIEDAFAQRVPVMQYASVAVSILLLICLYIFQPTPMGVQEGLPLEAIPASGTGEVVVESVQGDGSPVMVLKGQGDAAVVVLFEKNGTI